MGSDLCLSGIVTVECLGFSQPGPACSSWNGGVSRWAEGNRQVTWDHIEYMVLVLQIYGVYQESIGFASKKALPGERIAFVYPTLVST